MSTSTGQGSTAYDAEERTPAAIQGKAPASRQSVKPPYFEHLWVDEVLVSHWSVVAVARAVDLLDGSCMGPAMDRARQLGDALSDLAALQVQGDQLYASLTASYRAVYGVYLGALEQVALRNLTSHTAWMGFVIRYRAYQTSYHRWEVHEKAYWRWVAARYAHEVAVARWHAMQAVYDRYATALRAYHLALPTYYKQVQTGKRSRVPAPPVEPAWPVKPPPFTRPAPVRLPQPARVRIPPAPPYMEPLPVPPPAPPQWEMLVQANLRGIGRLGSPWGASYLLSLREDQLQEANAFEGISSFTTPVYGPVTTWWGGSTRFQSFHPGIDIAAPLGTPVRAAAEGVVRFAGYAVPGRPDQQYGLCVIIQYNQYISSLYGHLNDNIGLLVYPGETVHRGQVVGFVGMTGWTTGPHLHLELRFQGHPFDPMLAPGINP
jgi:murein DD-endopeptidase MepM/ murein hydrolase activator NlpD